MGRPNLAIPLGRAITTFWEQSNRNSFSCETLLRVSVYFLNSKKTAPTERQHARRGVNVRVGRPLRRVAQPQERTVIKQICLPAAKAVGRSFGDRLILAVADMGKPRD